MALFIVGDLNADELFDFVSRTSRESGEVETGVRPDERVYADEPSGVARRTGMLGRRARVQRQALVLLPDVHVVLGE